MKIRSIVLVAFLCCYAALGLPAYAQKEYVPPAGGWERRTPEQARLDPVKLKEAVDFAIASESKAPRSQAQAQSQTFGREPFGEAIGLLKDRGEPTGIIIRNGYIVAEWGEPDRVDMIHSVTKVSFQRRSAWPSTES